MFSKYALLLSLHKRIILMTQNLFRFKKEIPINMLQDNEKKKTIIT